jgi:hypothetical protein
MIKHTKSLEFYFTSYNLKNMETLIKSTCSQGRNTKLNFLIRLFNKKIIYKNPVPWDREK